MEENLDKYAFWIQDVAASGYGQGLYYDCSACGFWVNVDYGAESIKKYKFCPQCGRTMIHQTYKNPSP